jgi:hypothetical protein
MHIKCAYTDLKEVDKLILLQNPKNNNKHPNEQVDRLAKIIDFAGQRRPIVISKRSGFIIKGHCTLLAIAKLGWDKCAVDYQDYETEAAEYQDMTADNEIAKWAVFDQEKFKIDIEDLDLGDFELLGLKNNSFDKESEKSNNSEEQKQEFLIIIECENEEQQAKYFDKLQKDGVSCKII